MTSRAPRIVPDHPATANPPSAVWRMARPPAETSSDELDAVCWELLHCSLPSESVLTTQSLSPPLNDSDHPARAKPLSDVIMIECAASRSTPPKARSHSCAPSASTFSSQKSDCPAPSDHVKPPRAYPPSAAMASERTSSL